MTVLAYQSLMRRGNDLVEPFDPKMVQPASIDLTLGNSFIWFAKPPEPNELIDFDKLNMYGQIEHHDDEFIIKSHEFVLATTAEIITMPDDLLGSVDGKSSIGRMGLFVHVSAGLIDPGFKGRITLEFFNANDRSMIVRPGMAICQIVFRELDEVCTKPYGDPDIRSRYQGQLDTTMSRYTS